MTDLPQFDRLRRACSAQLTQFIGEAQQTQRRFDQLPLPASAQQVFQLMSEHRDELNACHEYLEASRRLMEFLQRQTQSIQ